MSTDSDMVDIRSTDLRVFAVVVTYLPSVQSLATLLMVLAPQLTRVVVVDNTPAEDMRAASLLDELKLSQVELIRLGANLGIAKALNVGIECAIKSGATHVLLSDQDSLPATDMVSGLLRAWSELTDEGILVGALGPTFTDLHTNTTLPFQVHVPGRFFYGHLLPSVEQSNVEALTLITSGALIPIAAFHIVGPMREDFFIDHVDIEWCLRARAAGFRLFGTGYASMHHRMGDAYLQVWRLGWHRESAYSPTRVYYRIRNFVVLCKAPYVSTRWKVRNALYWLEFIYRHVIFGDERWRSLCMALHGLRDGFFGKMGPLVG